MSVATIERQERTAVAHLHGDVGVEIAPQLYTELCAAFRDGEVSTLVVDFSDAGRIDSAGVAVLAVVGRELEHAGKAISLEALAPRHAAALALSPRHLPSPAPREPPAGPIERLGGGMIEAGGSVRALGVLVLEALRQALAVATGRRRLPAGAIVQQISRMGVDGLFIVGLLAFLIGMTIAFQGVVQLQRFGAGTFVADLIGLSIVRELGPLMTAIVVTGRTGAAIAAELGTMRVRSEIDVLATMGLSPVRFLVVPRIAAITVVVPALTLLAIFIGMAGGMLVARVALAMSAITFWQRVVYRVEIYDWVHGLGKSFVFAWIIGFSASHLGLRVHGDASSVGAATTRTVVASVFLIIVVDAIFATASTGRWS